MPPTPPPTIYLDHGATSWPKPPEVVAAVVEALTVYGGNPGRGAYRMAMATSRLIHESRRDVAAFLGVPDAHDLLFSPGCTEAMNLVLRGLLSPGDRVVACSMEHNAVARPLFDLAQLGVDVVLVDADATGTVIAEEVEARRRPGAAPARSSASTRATSPARSSRSPTSPTSRTPPAR